jgi:hypothetical protein
VAPGLPADRPESLVPLAFVSADTTKASSVCGPCHADDAAREETAAEAARIQAATPREPEHDQEPGKLRGMFRRRG